MSFFIRPVQPSDVAALLELELAVIRDGRGAVMSPDDAEREKARSERRLASIFEEMAKDDRCFVVADADGAIAGSATVRREVATYTRHVGALGIEVHPDHQRRGIGRALMRACEEWAKHHGIARLELFVREDNERARALYASEGFVHEGKREKFIRLPDGSFVDDFVYVRFF